MTDVLLVLLGAGLGSVFVLWRQAVRRLEAVEARLAALENGPSHREGPLEAIQRDVAAIRAVLAAQDRPPVAPAEPDRPPLVVAVERLLGARVLSLRYVPSRGAARLSRLPSRPGATDPQPLAAPAEADVVDEEKPPLVLAVEAALEKRVAWLRYQPAPKMGATPAVTAPRPR